MISGSAGQGPGERRVTQAAAPMAIFGSVWAAVGVTGLASRTTSLIVSGVIATALAVAVIALTVRFGASPGERRARRPSPNSLRVYGQVNIVQAITIVAAVVILLVLHEWVFLPPAVCLIIGLHFLPLARSFDQPQYWWTAGLLAAAGLAGFLVLAAGVSAPVSRIVVGFGAAVVLWAAALHVARRG